MRFYLSRLEVRNSDLTKLVGSNLASKNLAGYIQTCRY